MGFELATAELTAERLFPEIVRPNAAVIVADAVPSVLAACATNSAVLSSPGPRRVVEAVPQRLRSSNPIWGPGLSVRKAQQRGLQH